MNTQSSNTLSLTTTNLAQRQLTTDDGCLNPAAFEQFLCWLGPDAEAAGRKYESIRGRLIMMFRARRCVFAEDLADATIERVARKLTDLSIGFTGDPALYFYGVAKRIYLEYQRKIAIEHKRSASLGVVQNDNPDLEEMLDQLDEALSTISRSDRELILKYYSGDEKNKINRRTLAKQCGIGSNALRLRVFRIKKEIKNYMMQSGSNTLVAQKQF